MFADVTANSASRITEIREVLDFISPLIPSPPIATPRHLNTSKGLIYVQLYGTIECTITSTLAKAIYYINTDTPRIAQMQPPVWGLALHSELDGLIQANKKKWDKRRDLFQRIVNNDFVVIEGNIMPTNGDNFTAAQLQSIWHTFHINEPLFPKPEFRGRLQEIVANRINIAHGNTSASDVGSLVTIGDLAARIQEVSEFCSYFCNVFETYIGNKLYLKYN